MMKGFWPWFFLFLGVMFASLGLWRPDLLDTGLARVGTLLYVALAIALGLALVWLGSMLWDRYQDRKDRRLRMVDGAYALQDLRMKDGTRVFWNPNLSVSPSTAFHPVYGVKEVHDPAIPWDVTTTVRLAVEQSNAVRAAFPGDAARMDRHGSQSRAGGLTSGVVRALNDPARHARAVKGIGIADPAPAPQIVDAQTPALAYQIKDGREALEMSRANRWIVGQAEDGENATFVPHVGVHAGIIGATGTGKTSSIGLIMVLQAIRTGCKVIILDADGAADWSQFAPFAEYYETDPDTIPAQIAGLGAEMDRRLQAIKAAGVSSLSEADQGLRARYPAIYVFIEEFGDLMDTLRIRNSKAHAQTEAILDTILRRARKADIHMIFIDQYPEKWSQQLIGNVKTRYIFQLGPNQGAKVQEYKAADLPDTGYFLHRGKTYRSFYMRDHVAGVLRSVRANTDPPILGDLGSYSAQDVEPAEGVEVTDWPRQDVPKVEIVAQWLQGNPTGTQAEFRAWAERAGLQIARGTVALGFQKWTEAQAAGD